MQQVNKVPLRQEIANAKQQKPIQPSTPNMPVRDVDPRIPPPPGRPAGC